MIDLSAHGYRLTVAPGYGANVTGLDWTDAAGRRVPLLRACAESALVPDMPSPVGCFPMAPFANRIDQGVFSFDGRRHVLPVNRPDEAVAIHGLSRFAAFDVTSRTASALRLCHRHRGRVFAYDLVQDVRIDPSGVSIGLEITNRGGRMPFGLGLHPFFVRETTARLQVQAAFLSQAEERHLPARFVPRQAGPDFAGGALLEPLAGFDAHYAGWEPRRAVLDRPDAGIRVSMSATEAFSNLHVYVPPGGGLVCLEPVSHVPDVHNRAGLADFGDLVALPTGGQLSGRMHISATPLPR